MQRQYQVFEMNNDLFYGVLPQIEAVRKGILDDATLKRMTSSRIKL